MNFWVSDSDSMVLCSSWKLCEGGVMKCVFLLVFLIILCVVFMCLLL